MNNPPIKPLPYKSDHLKSDKRRNRFELLLICAIEDAQKSDKELTDLEIISSLLEMAISINWRQIKKKFKKEP